MCFVGELGIRCEVVAVKTFQCIMLDSSMFTVICDENQVIYYE